MIVNVVPIGNSKGIRIPKSVLEQCQITREVDMEIENGKIILKPIRRKSRAGWKEQFIEMNQNQDDNLIIPDVIDIDAEDWEW